jgi:hypothetical protein
MNTGFYFINSTAYFDITEQLVDNNTNKANYTKLYHTDGNGVGVERVNANYKHMKNNIGKAIS